MTENYLTILAETIRTNWDAPALTDFYLTEDGTAQDTSRGNHYTYGEMYTEVCRVADLLTALGLQKGDHIAICGANSAHWVIAYLAVAKMQGVSVTVMHTLQPDEIARLVNFSDAKALFTDPDLWSELSPMYQPSLGDSPSMHRPYMGDLFTVLSLADWTLLSCDQSADNFDTYTIDTRKIYDRYTLHSDTLTEGTQEETNPLTHQPSLGDTNSPSLRELVSFPQSAPDDLAMICFTSGTTNSHKGIMLSYRSISNNVKNITDGYPDDEVKVFLSVLPMAHMFGLVTEILAQLLKGKHVYILANITIEKLYNAIKIVQPYALRLIPFIVSSLVRFHGGTSILKTCKQIYIGGSLFDKQIEQELLAEKIPISIGYGQSEAGPIISYSVCSEYKLGTCGKIVSGMTCRISPSGEILVKGENVMLGYYKDPEATAAKIDSDGWLHTGDKGHLDEDGYLYVEGRLEQDIIVLPNGENIRPDHIESLINALPEVSESIVLARNGHLVALVVPDNSSPKLGEVSQRDGGVCIENTPEYLRRKILSTVNPQLPNFSQLYDVEITDTPLQRTEKQTIKRYLYK